MNGFLSIFRSGSDTYSSKRAVGIIGMMIIHVCYAVKCIWYGDSSDTIVLVTADTALLGVETVTNAIKSNNNDTTDNGDTDEGDASCSSQHQC